MGNSAAAGGAPDQVGLRVRPRRVAELPPEVARTDPAPCLGRHPARPNFASDLEYPGSVTELFGDSTRAGEWAAVRLWVEGQRIVQADAPGLARNLTGLTLLEAAAVGGETLAADALANAIGAAVTAAPDPDRVAVAMSGGVDSAVALLESGPRAIGVTLRLWIDPRGPDTERACC